MAGAVISKFAITLGIVLLVVSAIILFLKRKVKFEALELKPFVPLLFTYLFLTLSVLWSADKGTALDEILIQNGLFSVPILLTIHWTHLRRKVIVVTHFLFFVAVTASLCTLAFYAMPVEIAKDLVNQYSFFQSYPDVVNKTQFGLYSPFIDRLHFAYSLVFCTLCALYFGFYSSKWSYFFLSIFFIFIILMLGARGAQIGLLIALLPFLAYFLKCQIPSFNIFSIQTLFIGLAFLIIVPLSAYKLIPSVQKRYDQMRWEFKVIKDGSYVEYEYQHFTTLTRLKSFENSVQIIAENPFLGTGIGDVKNDLNQIYSQKILDIPVHHQNYFLYLWMAGGIMAVLAFMSFLIYWCYYFFHKHERLLERTIALSYTIFITIILLIDAPLKYHLGVFTMPAFLMLIMACVKDDNPDLFV